MADKGIIFNAPMVRALLDGRKTQTRRLCAWANNPNSPALTYIVACDEPGWFGDEEGEVQFRAPYAPGDRLYVREAYYQMGHWEPAPGKLTKGGKQKWAFVGVKSMVMFSEPEGGALSSMDREFPGVPRWYKRLGRFMPRSFSRLWLEVTDVRVQRVQEISEADARAEGLAPVNKHFPPMLGCDGALRTREVFEWDKGWSVNAVPAFEALWNSLHTKPGETWADNPWIVAVTFNCHRGNIDNDQ